MLPDPTGEWMPHTAPPKFGAGTVDLHVVVVEGGIGHGCSFAVATVGDHQVRRTMHAVRERGASENRRATAAVLVAGGGRGRRPPPPATAAWGIEPIMRSAVSSDRAPQALGPYSQAIVAGGFVFCSGMAGIDPTTGAVPDGIEAQTDQALSNLDALLAAAGASIDDVVKTTVYYSDVEDFPLLNEVSARRVPTPPPARSAPANVRLPHGLLVSIDAIAVVPS
jgi:2-iminobutanoate/2-iminopropanoate deaminase